MNKPVKKIVSIDKLTVDQDLNIRERDNYDLPQMMEQIVTAGRIIKPLIVKEEEREVEGKKEKLLIVLSGNRRTLAGQELFRDDKISVELKEALSKVDIIVYTGLNPTEELSLIIDHGSEKQISRTEIVNSVWRLDKQFFSESQIINMLYFALARYSGNEKKLLEVPTEPKARGKFLHSWLHGTVGNYILNAAGMGEYVRTQFILTHRSEDKLLKPTETVEVKMSRERINQLSAARTLDRDTNKGGKGWNVETGGENFNELLQKFKEQDAGLLTKEEPPKRPSVKDLRSKADIYKSPAIRTALLVAAGDKPEGGKELLEMDDTLHNFNLKMEVLRSRAPEIKDTSVKTLVHALLNGAPAAAVEDALKVFCQV